MTRVDLITWLIIGLLGFAVVVAGTIFLTRRRLLPPAPSRPALPEEPKATDEAPDRADRG